MNKTKIIFSILLAHLGIFDRNLLNYVFFYEDEGLLYFAQVRWQLIKAKNVTPLKQFHADCKNLDALRVITHRVHV